jgi:hypothetical protein
MSFTDLNSYVLKGLDGGKWTVGYTYIVQNFGQLEQNIPNPTWHVSNGVQQSTAGLEFVTGSTDIGVTTQPSNDTFLVWTVDYQTSGIFDTNTPSNNIGVVQFPIVTTEGNYTLTSQITIEQFNAPVISNITIIPHLPTVPPGELLEPNSDVSLNFDVKIDSSFFPTPTVTPPSPSFPLGQYFFASLTNGPTVIFDTSLNIRDSNDNIIPTTVTLPSPVTATNGQAIPQEITFVTPLTPLDLLSTIQNFKGTFLASYTSPPLYQIAPGTGNANIASNGVTSSEFYFSLPAFIIPTIPDETFTFYVKEESEIFDLSLAYNNPDNLSDGSYNIKIFSGPNFINYDNVITDTNKWPGYIYDNSTIPLEVGNDISLNDTGGINVKFAWPGNQYIGTSIFQIYAEETTGTELKSDIATITVIFKYSADDGCDTGPGPNPTRVWTRDDGNCTDLSGATLNGSPMTRADLSEKRKAVIFQYKNNSAGFSKKQQFSRLARGLGKPRGKTYATQGYNVTNPNVQNLPLVGKNVPTVVENGAGNFVTQDVFMGTTLVCTGANKISGLTTQNDTPGPTRTITNYPTVPLTNYIVRRTYKGGSEKWPQYGPNTGQPRLPKYARNTGTKPGMNFWRPGSN